MHRGKDVRAALMGIVGALFLVAGAVGQPRGSVVELANGVRVDVGYDAATVERWVDSGRLPELAERMLQDGGPNDAAAVLVYASRYRPRLASTHLLVGLELAAARRDPMLAGLVAASLATEPSVDPYSISATLDTSALPAGIRRAALIAMSAPAAGPGNGYTSDGYARDGLAGEGSGGGAAASDGNTGAAAGLRGWQDDERYLPLWLRIGGSGGAAREAPDPPPDGGVSG